MKWDQTILQKYKQGEFMRVLYGFFAFSLMFASGALAEEATQPNAGSAASGTGAASSSSVSVGGQGASNSSASTSSALPNSSTISTDLKGATAKRKFKGEYLNWTQLPVADFKNRDGSASSYNWVGVKYMLGETTSISLRQPFTLDYSYAKKDEKGVETKSSETNAHVSDLFVNVGDSKFVQFAGDGKISAAVRVYLPTGEKSRLTKTMGGINLRGIVSKPISKVVTLNYNFFPTWLNQTQNSYSDSSGAIKPNVDYTLFQFASVDWSFSKYVGFTQAVGTDSTWYRQVSDAGKDIAQEHYAYIDSSLSISGIPDTDVSVGVSNSPDIHRPKQSFGAFRDSETTYYFIVATTL